MLRMRLEGYPDTMPFLPAKLETSDMWIRTSSMTALAALLSLSGAAWAQSMPSDGNSFKGDHLRLFTNLKGISKLGETGGKLCAPAGSRLAVSDQDDQKLYVRFLTVSGEDETFKFDEAALTDPECKKEARVNTFTSYELPTANFLHTDFRRSGVTFGGLVVPFKLRLGKEKHLVSSSTIAPYVGFRTAWSVYGLTFTPVMALGLSNVPVTDATTNNTESKAAYTVAVGLRLGSSKNEQFNAGILFGHDFLNRSDRMADPTVGKPWLSAYLGYSM